MLPPLQALKQKSKADKKVVNREICQMYTKGTYTDTSKGSYEPNYVLAIKKDGDNYGICFFDISTFKCYLGSFIDDSC